ncbi:GNAT family N-acetyltransferase [Paludicola sp. MB14-C6]|uniref:GNAT family N-acetyltransferase n=1 Tax=Paludihabitans sp. MB14-C6 TaxID=3070656 RepID=UPI0027DE5E83|nr:GNAT family N-acetyltransferase [Paludicola sp. MB14-C6]WMJ22153.1 GNAT family N-acetyltransferase [Paludicola sp. MB14-C6]
MQTITYQKISSKNFTLNSLDNLNRYQKVDQCFRKMNGNWELQNIAFIEDWDLEKKHDIANETLISIHNGCIAYGAYDNDLLIGFVTLGNERFGGSNQYIELKCLQVSFEHRRFGIGKKLFHLACEGAKELSAKKLYISAHSSKESQAFYRTIGCVDAMEINKSIAEKEPCDCQMEYTL